jgi:anti-sigma B factor antagonist/stage II sporulation protein AA (anti-sigma F factor antagonist)
MTGQLLTQVPAAARGSPADRATSKPITPTHTLRIRTDRYGDALVVHLAGAADLLEAGRLRQHLVAAIRRARGPVVVDLAGLGFLGPVGLGGLVAAHLQARRHGTPLRLAAARPLVRELLQRAGLTRMMSVHATVAQALCA